MRSGKNRRSMYTRCRSISIASTFMNLHLCIYIWCIFIYPSMYLSIYLCIYLFIQYACKFTHRKVMDFRQTLFKPHWSLSVVRPTKKCLPFANSKWRVPWTMRWGHWGHVMYPSHIISSSTYPSQVHLNDKSCTLNFRYSGTPNIPSLLFHLKEIHVTSLMNILKNTMGITLESLLLQCFRNFHSPDQNVHLMITLA